MNLNISSIQAGLDTAGIPLGERSGMVASALARGVAYRLPLPTSPVPNPYQYYAETLKADAETVIAKLNEVIVMDFAQVTDLTFKLWLFRYRMVFDAAHTSIQQFIDAAASVGSIELPPPVAQQFARAQTTPAFDQVHHIVGQAFGEGEG